MQISDIFTGLGEDRFSAILRTVSMGKLKTYQLFERFKTRCHLQKLNTETLRRVEPKLFERIKSGEDELATEIAQSILICHLDLIIAVLNFLEVPHEEGFFQKDVDVSTYLKDGWEGRVYEQFKDKFPEPVVLFYINHLSWEVLKTEKVYQPAL
ncbi:MAG TPA: hypothetical protein VGL53_16010 [Bryobacteraceae bacterium]|jgi:hypothetical protein